MTNTGVWEEQPGGLLLSVQSFDKTSLNHRHAAANIMRSSVQTVAQTHGASFNEIGFRNNMKALYTGDIVVDFFLAKWDVCEPKPLCVGAAVNWNTYGITPDGTTGFANYTEDVCLLAGALRQLVRGKPKDKEFPEESLAQCFERIFLQNKLIQEGAAYRFGEVDRDNTKMIRTLDGNGASIGAGLNSAVLELRELPNNLLDNFPMNVGVIEIRRKGKRDENNFIVRWNEGPFDIRFIATKGRATAIGYPRTDIRPWHNGNLPDQAILDCVMASSLLAIKREAEDRSWGAQRKLEIPSPIIPLSATRPEIYAALYDACGKELAINVADHPAPFGKPMPEAHIYIINDQRMLDAFTAVNASPRLFGKKPMIPAVNVLKLEIKLVA